MSEQFLELGSVFKKQAETLCFSFILNKAGLTICAYTENTD
jgi:hypothetical protein